MPVTKPAPALSVITGQPASHSQGTQSDAGNSSNGKACRHLKHLTDQNLSQSGRPDNQSQTRADFDDRSRNKQGVDMLPPLESGKPGKVKLAQTIDTGQLRLITDVNEGSKEAATEDVTQTLEMIALDNDCPAKINGADRTPIELFIAEVRGWEADLRRHFPGKPEK